MIPVPKRREKKVDCKPSVPDMANDSLMGFNHRILDFCRMVLCQIDLGLIVHARLRDGAELTTKT